MSNLRHVFVPGIPQQKGNIIRGRHGGYHDANKRLVPWIQQIIAAIHNEGWEPILSGPVHVDCWFVFPRPKAHYGTGRNAERLKDAAPQWHAKAPDIDKLLRSVLDALTQAGAVTDDGQVASVTTSKRWLSPGETPGVQIVMSRPTA